MQSVYLISGEHSGDSHGADLIASFSQIGAEVDVHGLGGPKMNALAPKVRDWVDDAAVVGFVEVLKHYSWFKKQFQKSLEEIQLLQPDAVVFIDYPGFNLRLAKALYESGFKGKLIYYISPQVWAWNKKRIPKMAKWLDRMLCLFPFEKSIFEEAGLPTELVGHPLVEELAEAGEAIQREESLIGMFPGSREREIERLFPVMLATAKKVEEQHPDWRFAVPVASSRFIDRVTAMRDAAGFDESNFAIQLGGSRELMQRAQCGIVASGTATLEAAYFGLPYSLIYKVAWPTYFMGRILIKLKFIGIVNILADRELVHEFIQADAEPCALADELIHFMLDAEYREKVSKELLQTAQLLGEPGASNRAARAIAKEIGG